MSIVEPEEDLKSPVLSKRVQIHKSTYTLYHGRVTWNEAASFCRKQGTRLAILKNPSIIEILSNSMTKTRPGILKNIELYKLTYNISI